MTVDTSRGGATDGADHAHAFRLVAASVRLRFGVSCDEFADHVTRLARRSPCPALSFPERVGRLRLDDLYLAWACARGDEAAWDELARRHFAFVRDFARRFLPEPASIDLADQVIADLWQARKIARYEGRSTLRTWLGAVVANAALRFGKAERRRVPLTGERLRRWEQRQSAPADGVLGAQAAAVMGWLVHHAVRELPAGARHLVLLYYECGLTLEEMGAALGCSKATLSRRLKGIRGRLRCSIDALARRHLGVCAAELFQRLDLAQLDLDLARLLRPAAAQQTAPAASKQ